MKIFILLALVFSLTIKRGYAATALSGKELIEQSEHYEKCSKEYDSKYSLYTGAFIGYVVAIAECGNGIFFDMPQNSQRKQVFAVVVKYLKNNPSEWHKRGQSLVVDALQEAFPLKKQD